MKCHILCDFRTSNLCKEKSFEHFRNIHKLKLLTNFDDNQASFLGEVLNYV